MIDFLNRPIVVLTMSRSGSSMFCGLLVDHGAWLGNCNASDKWNKKGYFENSVLNNRAGLLYPGSIFEDLTPAPPILDWKDFVLAQIKQQGYRAETPWASKMNVFHWPIWQQFNPLFVTIRRDTQAIVDSCMRMHKGTPYTYTDWHRIVHAHIVELDKVENRFNAIRIQSEKIIQGDYSGLQSVLNVFNLEVNPDICKKFIDVNLWSQKKC